jgi:hypothetical protein
MKVMDDLTSLPEADDPRVDDLVLVCKPTILSLSL